MTQFLGWLAVIGLSNPSMKAPVFESHFEQQLSGISLNGLQGKNFVIFKSLSRFFQWETKNNLLFIKSCHLGI